jgi:hypothetical protein
LNLTTHDLVRLLFGSIFLFGLMVWRVFDGGDGDGNSFPFAMMGVGVFGFVCAQVAPAILRRRKRRERRGFDVVTRGRGVENDAD